jgi:prepilin-type N-terminal cleavage/methylation domain-containing protein
MTKKNTGFTLIELLVVVLIIGILAAIAVPQYQKAVEKSRAAEALLNVRALAEAVKRAQLASGALPGSFDELDITIPGTSVVSAATGVRSEIIANDNFAYYIDKNNNTLPARRKKTPSDTDWGNSDFAIAYWFGQDPRTTSAVLSPDSMVCAVKSGIEKEALYKSICKSFGAMDAKSVVISGYVHYKIN